MSSAAHVRPPCQWLRSKCGADPLLLGPDGAVLGTCVIEGVGRPDLGTVDDVARLQLRAQRVGGRVVVETALPVLLELLELAGLPVEVRGQTEDGENGGRVQEEVQPGDPPV